MMLLQRFFISVLILMAWSFGTSVHAAENPAATSAAATSSATSGSGKKEPRKQTITFEDELVEGTTQKPDLFYLFQKKNFNFKRMMKLRNDFIPEMKRSTEDVQRGRGSN